MFENRRFLVLPVSEIDNINFDEVIQLKKDLRISNDGLKTFVKYDIIEVESDYDEITYDALDPSITTTNKVTKGIYGRPSIWNESYEEYTYDQFINILKTSEWVENGNDN